MVEVIRAMAQTIFALLQQNILNVGGKWYSLWDIVIASLLCSLVGFMIYAFLRVVGDWE